VSPDNLFHAPAQSHASNVGQTTSQTEGYESVTFYNQPLACDNR